MQFVHNLNKNGGLKEIREATQFNEHSFNGISSTVDDYMDSEMTFLERINYNPTSPIPSYEVKKQNLIGKKL